MLLWGLTAMRDYSRVEPKMWHGSTVKALRKCPEGLIVALYLTTSPQSNMLGLFSQPVMYMAYETGLGLEGATKGLAKCIEVGFCAYDEASEFVWVYEMAKYQIAPFLKATDLRVKGVQREYDNLPENPFLGPFFDRYHDAFLIAGKRELADRLKGATQAPSKPLPSQEQEQEQEQEQALGATAPLSPARLTTVPGPEPVKPGEHAIPACPLKQLVGLFVMKCPTLPKPRYELFKESAAAEAMRQRWKWLLSADATREDDSRYATNPGEALDWFGRFFENVHASDFLSGRSGGWGKCDLAWLMKRENFMKVVQGNYANKPHLEAA